MAGMSSPNILFILTDDLGQRDLGCYGSTFYETPHLDRLARRGMLFSDGYAACPVCSPTRASVMSGKYPANVGVTNFISHAGNHPSTGRLIDAPYIDHLPAVEHTLADALRDGGYQTWHVGKWHLGREPYWPQHRGFDVNVGGNDCGHPKGGYFAPWNLANLPGDDVPEGTYLDEHLTDRAVELIEQRDADRPFFLNFWPYLVHTPIQAPEHLVEKYRAKAAAWGLDQIDPLVEGDLFPCDHKKDQRLQRRMLQSHPVYAAMVEMLDICVGRLLDAIEAAGQADDTIVIFTSDNGGLATAEGSPTCNFPLAEGKGWMYEGGVRESLIVSWPGVTVPGSTCDVPVTSPDFYPTLLEVAGLDPLPDQHTDGVSFADLLHGDRTLEREAIYWHYPHYGNQGGTPGSSVRCGAWKLIEFFEDGRQELYHLPTDLGEDRNLADAEPATRDRLHAMLKDWREKTEAKIPQINPDYQPPTDPASDPTV